jgi:hypothetical protein
MIALFFNLCKYATIILYNQANTAQYFAVTLLIENKSSNYER